MLVLQILLIYFTNISLIILPTQIITLSALLNIKMIHFVSSLKYYYLLLFILLSKYMLYDVANFNLVQHELSGIGHKRICGLLIKNKAPNFIVHDCLKTFLAG